VNQPPIYLDNHATTRVDPRVVEAMAPYWTEHYGNAGSVSHAFGEVARDAVERSRERLAAALGAESAEIVFTSGATESNNLAFRGVMERRQVRGRHLVSVVTEHRAVLDPLRRLARRDHEVTYLPVYPASSPTHGGLIDLDQLQGVLRPETQLVSVMLANNEIGVIQPIAQIAQLCRERGVLVHCDATQAVGRMDVNVSELGVDLLSFSAHKLYGPKGIGALYVRRQPSLRLASQIDGGGQERGVRSGTLPVPLIVGFAKAVELCLSEQPTEGQRLRSLRQRLFDGIQNAIPECELNGPDWKNPLAPPRLDNNLNLQFPGVDGQSLMLAASEVAVSSGSACSSTNPEPSHVLRGIGLDDDQVRSSLRFGLGRYNTSNEIDRAVESLAQAIDRLRRMGG
jgi:cysteine desulfurase